MNHNKLFAIVAELEDLFNRSGVYIAVGNDEARGACTEIVYEGQRYEFSTYEREGKTCIDLDGNLGLCLEYRKFRGRN